MKYTVVIKEPVSGPARQKLEQELMKRFGLSGDQAQRLSARKTGRLIKPTSRSRAELLLNVYLDIGAFATLEEVPEEDSLLTPLLREQVIREQADHQRRQGAFSVNDTLDDAPLAPLMTSPVSSQELFTAQNTGVLGHLKPSRSPVGYELGDFGAGNTLADWPSPEHVPDHIRAWEQAAQPSQSQPSQSQPSQSQSNHQPQMVTAVSEYAGSQSPTQVLSAWSRSVATASPPPNSDSLGSELNGIKEKASTPSGADIWSDFTGSLSAGANTAKTESKSTPVNVASAVVVDKIDSGVDAWSDFTGSLSAGNNVAKESTKGAVEEISPNLTSITPILMSSSQDEPTMLSGSRFSLFRQIVVGTLAPLGLFSLLTLGVMALTLPKLQSQVVKNSTNTLAASIGANLSTASAKATNAQLDNVLKDSDVDFIWVELPSGASYIRAKDPNIVTAFKANQSEWFSNGTESQTVELNGSNYAMSRVSFAKTDNGTAVSTQAPYIRRVTVGLPNNAVSSQVKTILLLVLAIALLSLALATLLATSAARQITRPIERLVKVADAISLGDLTRPVYIERNDELGDLAQALERMRLSLEAAMERLRRRKR